MGGGCRWVMVVDWLGVLGVLFWLACMGFFSFFGNFFGIMFFSTLWKEYWVLPVRVALAYCGLF